MIIFLGFLLIGCAAGNMMEDDTQVIYIPKKAASSTDEGRNEGWYCYHFTWMGKGHDKNTFEADFKNKTCSDYYKDDPTLCVDPMTVTISGGKPDLDYIRKYHFKEATCKLSEDRVCAKYTIYYNGVASHVVRYCTRIDVVSEGPLQSGCLTAKNGSYEHEVCACMSGYGEGGICNSSARNHSCIFIILSFFIVSLLLYEGKYINIR